MIFDWKFWTALGLACVVTAGSVWKIQDWRYDAKEKGRIEQEAKELARKQDRVNHAATVHEKEKERIRTEFLTITEEVERVIEKPVYRDICLDDDGLRILRAAVSSTGSQPKDSMPAVK